MPEFAPPVRRDYLSSQVAAAIEERIRLGEFAPGSKLPTEVQLCAEFGVSRSALREALSRLKSRQLLTSHQGRGAYVAPSAHLLPLSLDPVRVVSAEAVVELLELRAGFEVRAASLAAMRRSTAQLRRIRECVGEVGRAVAAGGEGIAEDFAFHSAVCEATGNEYFFAIEQFLFQYSRVGSRVSRADPAKAVAFADETDREHRAIFKAIADRDERAASDAAQGHVDAVVQRIRMADRRFWDEEAKAVAGSLVRRRQALIGG